MKTTSRIRNFTRTSFRVVLLVGAAALAVTTSGCIVDDSGPGYGGGCTPDLFVDWQIQNSAGAPVTCAGAGAATVVVTVSGAAYAQPVDYPQVCVANQTYSSVDLLLAGGGIYDVTVSLYDATGNSLAPAQSISLDINSCGSYQTPSAALLVVSPPAS
jgi:hypothetical protein